MNTMKREKRNYDTYPTASAALAPAAGTGDATQKKRKDPDLKHKKED